MKNIQLEKPIVFFDIEATGLHVIRDRIVQIALIKYLPDEDLPIECCHMINPAPVEISIDAQSVHGICQSDVENCPTFSEIANELWAFIGDADLVGYNSDRFDIPMLMEEFARVGLDFTLEGRRTIDVQTIFYKMEPRTLSAAYSFYCGKSLENAHDALVDVRATAEILSGQIERYRDQPYQDEMGMSRNPISGHVEDMSRFTTNDQVLDATQRLKRNDDGVVVFNFGKYIGMPVGEVLHRDKNYYEWIQQKEFSVQVKHLTKQLLLEYEKTLD